MLERDLAHRVDVRLRAFGTDVLVNKSAHVRLAASRDMVGTCAQELGGSLGGDGFGGERAGWRAVVVCAWARGGGGRSEGGGAGGQRKGEEKGAVRASFGGGCGRGEQAVEVRTGSVWEGARRKEGEGRGRGGEGVPVDRQHFERVECDEDLARVGVDISLNVALLGVVEDTGFVQMDQGTVVRRDSPSGSRKKHQPSGCRMCPRCRRGAGQSGARPPAGHS